MLKYLKELCLMPGPTSFESKVCDVILDIAVNEGHADSVRKDVMGNLFVEKKSKNPAAGKLPKLMIAAHMDEVGFIVKKIDNNGYVRFVPVGGIDKRVVLGHKVWLGEDMIPGIIGLKAFHLVSAAEEKKAPDYVDMYIDIGCRNKEDAEKLVAPGDPIVFDSDFVEFGGVNKMIKCKAIDDRFGCAAMLNLMQEELPMDVTYVFTVQEEAGLRGAAGAAYSVKPDIALVLEGASSADVPTAPLHQRVTRAGQGAVIGLADGKSLYDEKLFHLLRDLAEENDIPWQVKTLAAGGTDAGIIHLTREGARVANISVACRNIHTASSVASVSDIDNAYKLLKLFVMAVAAGKAKK